MAGIVFYTSGTTGSGRIVKGISIGNALKRNNIDCRYTIVSSCPFGFLVDKFNHDHVEIPVEDENLLAGELCRKSKLYTLLQDLDPDILIVDLQWFMLARFIDDFSFKKVFLCTNLNDRKRAELFFNIPLPGSVLHFNPGQYDLLTEAEPTSTPFNMKHINPLVIRSRDEILSRDEASKALGLNSADRNCLFSINGKPGEYEDSIKTYAYFEDEGYRMIYSTNYGDGIFPVADYFNAFDLLITGGGYNSFWEAVYFEKEALFIPFPRNFENQKKRIEAYSGMSFRENGADQLVEIIMNL